ncbi:MAG TPA: peptide chain release factor N(5)-glutamine methyltransferase [Anaerolineales bacterium]|nr:peptide chain release factor N(5)-glutamine methyltransferase [Anaerolineales bacterium]
MDKATSLYSDLTIRLAHISDTPALDASVLISHILNKPRTWVLAHPELTLTPEQQKQLNSSLDRLEAGEPFPYVLGKWEFFGLEFDVTPDVLIPRPETELLVEKAIAWLQSHPKQRVVADVGTGSGAIAISIEVHVPDVKILATDISSKALQVAKQNAEKHGVNEKIEFVECDLLPKKSSFANRQSSIDLLCANLPYIPTKELQRLPIYNREPTPALDGGEDGLDQIRRLLRLAPNWLAPNGLMLLEIEANHPTETLSLAREAFPKGEIRLHQDLAGKDRLLSIERTHKADRNEQ